MPDIEGSEATRDPKIPAALQDALEQRRNLPASTYRIQFHAGFTFRDAIRIVPYLRELGITHVYASPYLKARPGSTHGYDVIDHHVLNPEIGTEGDYADWIATLKQNGMGHILDIVPNHMGVGTNENAWWNDVLAHGRESRYANYFDIAWDKGKLLLPLLGKPYGDALEAGELKLTREKDGSLAICYHDRRFPISPKSAEKILRAGNVEQELARLKGKPGDPASFDALDDLIEQQSYRLAYWRVAPDEINYRRFFDINDLAALRMERQEVFDSAHERILGWLADGTLQGVRIDHPDGLYDPKQYFERLQIAYVEAVARKNNLQLDEARAEEIAEQLSRATPGGWPLYVTVEKILAIGEPLPREWAVHGTSGYDFLDLANGLFVDPAGEAPLSRMYADFIGRPINYADLVYEKKRLILDISLASELHMLADRLVRLAQRDRHWRDFTPRGLRDALREVIACFPVYRSYISVDGVRPDDRRYIDQAIDEAIARNPNTEPSVFHFIKDMLLLKDSRFFTQQDRDQQLQFAGKFQQLTAPVTAKGIEDTSFYIFNRLVSLNEVGGDPFHFGVKPDELHQYFSDRQANWPFGLSPLSTHDTKRSEDVRARINVLSEMPNEWAEHVTRWRQLNSPVTRVSNPCERSAELCTAPDSGSSPARVGNPCHNPVSLDPSDEYLLYQTLIGAWPLDQGIEPSEEFVKRIMPYMEKAIREAKVHTSWTNQNEGYESAVKDFISRILNPAKSGEFLRDFAEFQRQVADLGLFNSLSQTLLRIAGPGVPDTYQGTELWDLSLVDPDNRRPVDYALRARMLNELRDECEKAGADRSNFARRLVENRSDGRAKLYTTWRALCQRRAMPELFTSGDYVPLECTGSLKDHVFAFARRREESIAIAIIPRLMNSVFDREGGLPIGLAWKDTAVSIDTPGTFEETFTGRRFDSGASSIRLSDLLRDFPVALLLSVAS